MQVVVYDLLTSYVKAGTGQTVLLLHGWGDRASGLAGLQQKLAGKYEVIAVDLPGFGGSASPTTAWGLTDYAAFVQQFLRKIGVKKIHAIIGHSNGGAIAIRGVAAGLLQPDKLVLMATAGIRGEYKGRVRALRVLTKIGKTLATPLPQTIKKKLRSKVYQTVGSDMLVAEHLQETFKKIVTDDVRKDAAKITIPALLMYGGQDRQTPVWYGEAYYQLISDATFELLPDAGHFIHLDRPELVERHIEEFLL